MEKIIYHVKPEERTAEEEWLRSQKVYPSVAEGWDFKHNASIIKIGVIVNEATALAIKLRHKLDLHTEYRQR